MIKAILALITIPLIGFLVSNGIVSSLASSVEDDYSVPLFIEGVKLMCSNDYSAGCSEFENLFLLRTASIYSGLSSLFIVLFYFSVSKICGTNRKMISTLFPPLIPIILLAISIQTFVQGVILTYGVYVAESYWIERVHFILIGAIGFGSFIGAIGVLGSTFSFTKKLVHNQIGHKILPTEQPKIWDLVNNIADEINSKPPDNIIVGIEPTFYATAANVAGCGDEILKGETLYLSLPLMRLFNESELKAVIGHELGHFSAKDTSYTTKFAPVYRGLGNSISSLGEGSGGASDFAKIPPLIVLSSMYESFEKNVSAISREREFEADKVGVSVSSENDLVYSLSKVILFSSLWNNTRRENIKRLNEGKISPNLSLIFKDSAAFNLSKKSLEEEKDNILKKSITHPTDSHPPLLDRILSIGFDPKDLDMSIILKQGESCNDLIENVEKIEEDLTTIEHQMMISLGYAVLPEEQEQKNGIEQYIYSMAAGMIGADGKIEQEEIASAERLGAQLVNSFDNTDFRVFINNLDKIPNILDLAKDLNRLDDKNKKIIFEYISAIASADGDIAEEELRILDKLKKIWEVKT